MWQNTRQNNLWFYTDCLTLYHDTWVHQMILHRLPHTVPWYMGASNDSTQTASHCTMIHGCIKWFYTDCLTLYHDTWVHQMILHRLPHTVPWYMGASNDSTQTASHCTMIHGCIKWFYTDCLTLYHDTWVHQMILHRLPHTVPWYMGASNDSTQTASHCTMIHGCIKWFYTDCLTLYHDTWVHQMILHRLPHTVPWYMGASNDSTQTASHCTMIHGCIKEAATGCIMHVPINIFFEARIYPHTPGYSLVPRPPPFFVLRFAFSIIHRSGRVRKTGKAWEHLSCEWRQVDRGGRRGEGVRTQMHE